MLCGILTNKIVILFHHESVNMQIVDSALGLKPDICHWVLVSNIFFHFFFFFSGAFRSERALPLKR